MFRPLLALAILILSGCVSQAPLISHDWVLDEAVPGISGHDTTDTERGSSELAGLCKDTLLANDLEAEPELWSRVKRQLTFPIPDHRQVRAQKNWYLSHPAYMRRVSDRATPYLYDIVSELEKRNMPLELALLPIVESAYDPFAYSHGRASGMWQFIPGTGKRFGLRQDWWYDGRRDVYLSTRAALDYLAYLHKRFKGNWLYALAAYNSGEGNVIRAIRRNKKKHRPTDFFSLRLPVETEAYVPKLLALAAILKDPDHADLWSKVDNKPFFRRVATGSQIDLALIADLADLEMADFYQLNPAFNQWATSPKGPHYVLLPVDLSDRFEKNLAKVPGNERLAFKRYTIKPGDSLLKIAKKFRTQVALLKQTNGIRGNQIRAGKSILIPTASAGDTTYAMSARQRLTARQNAKRNGYKRTIYVKEGDSFWSLSRQYKVNLRSLAKWNGMAPTDPLKIGQKLVLWQKSSPRVALMESAGKKKTRKIYYKVRNGDSLALIANKFNVSLTSIKRWNKKISRKKYLQPGDSLTLFVDITRQYN